VAETSTRPFTRRDLLARVVGVGAATVGVATLASYLPADDANIEAIRWRALGGATPASVNAERAVAAFDAMQRHLLVPDGHLLYRERDPETNGNRYAYVWSTSEALTGTMDMVGIPDHLLGGSRGPYASAVADRFQALKHYWHEDWQPPCYASYVPPPYGHGGDRYFDDNIVLGLALIQWYRLNGASAADLIEGGSTRIIGGARQIFDFIVPYGWAGERSDRPGGVYWTDAGWNHDRGTYCCLAGAKLALHLASFADTSPGTDQMSAYYTGWADRMFAWARSHLYDPASTLYQDKVFADGRIDESVFPYNQGAAIGTHVLLYRATQDSDHLRQAERIASAALAYFTSEPGLLGQEAVFNGHLLRNLLLLHPYTTARLQTDMRKALQDYADAAWTNHRRSNGLFTFPYSGGAYRLLDQAGMVQVYALLAWSEEDYANLA
jgi:hypothetical protein